MYFTRLLFTVMVVGGSVLSSNAQDNSFEGLIRKSTSPIQIENGKLSGKGAEIIVNSLKGKQFVAFGEDHNKRAVHRFGEALFLLLHDKYNFNYLALEEDPYWGKLLSRASKKGGAEEVLKLTLRYPNAFHLLTESEIEMIGNIGKISDATNPIWGLNQIFGAAHVYRRLVDLAPNLKARTVAWEFYNQSLEYEKERFQKKIHYLVQIAKPDDFERLKAVFRPRKGSEVEFLIDQLALSNQIFAPYNLKPSPPTDVFYESGRAREINMKRLFAQSYKEAQQSGDRKPKVLAMFGQLHLYRGLSERTEQYTLGNFLSEFANFNNEESFHIYAVTETDYIKKGPFAQLAKIASEIAEKSGYGAVVNLRTLFDDARFSKNMDPASRRLIMGYDVLLFFRDSENGSLVRLQTPNFHWYP